VGAAKKPQHWMQFALKTLAPKRLKDIYLLQEIQQMHTQVRKFILL